VTNSDQRGEAIEVMVQPEKRKCSVELTVPFHDMDAMQVVYHGNYLKYFDVARHRLFEQAGIDLYEYGMKTGILFPIVKQNTKYIFPLRVGDRFVCEAMLKEARRQIVLDFEIRKLPEEVVCARSQSVQVTVRRPDFKLELSIPKDIRQALLG